MSSDQRESAALPAGLRKRVLVASEQVRPAGHSYPDVAAADHVESTRSAAGAYGRRPLERTRTEWRRAVGDTLARVESMNNIDIPVAMHGLRTTLAKLLLVRTFELWTHDNDIRRAVGLVPTLPDGSTLRLMTAMAAEVLPLGAARIGLRDPTQAELSRHR